MAAAAMAGAQHAVESIKAETGPVPPVTGSHPGAVVLPNLGAPTSAASSTGLGMLSDVNLHVKVELGRTRMYVEDVLRLNADSVIELDKLAGDPVDIYVNDRHVARGEVLVVNDNFCVRVSEIVDSTARG
jgi:flagellar motor switch protein FliN/FliY